MFRQYLLVLVQSLQETIFITSSISLFDNISVLIPDSIFFYWFQHLLVVMVLFILMVSTHSWPTAGVHFSSTQTYFYEWSKKSTNESTCDILDSGVIENFILANDSFVKALQRLAICRSVNNCLWWKLVSLLLIIFHDNPRVTTVAFFVADFNCSAMNLIFYVYLIVLSRSILMPK